MEKEGAPLELRLLGELEVLRADVRVELPPSRKTRALLAYLAATGRPHRRERLCTIFWEIPDDPRGSLRWSLSRLRAIVDDSDAPRIIADRDTVAFDITRCRVDVLAVRALDAKRLDRISTPLLAEAADRFRGEFLEDLDLPRSHDFQSWCAAEREDLRRLNARILAELRRRHDADPETALTYARRLVHADPFNEDARADFLRLLMRTGRRQEAESQFESAERLFRELGEDSADRLRRLWRSERVAAGTRAAGLPPGPGTEPAPSPAPSPLPFIGRAEAIRELIDVVDQAIGTLKPHLATVLGEPGIGKSRLVAELAGQARGRGVRVLAGRSYDTRLGAAYAPWIEALGELPEVEAAADADRGRQRLFAAIASKVSENGRTPLLLIFDDIQWMDGASGDLLQFVLRSLHGMAVAVILAAREGELPDNPAVTAMLRSLRRDHPLREIRLAPLEAKDIELLVRTTGCEADIPRIVSLSGGNPLYALELSRSLAEQPEILPHSLKELVRDRLERLPADAAEILRWASVLGPGLDPGLIEPLCALGPDQFVRALESLERHGMLYPERGGGYAFSHGLVHQAVYTGLSEPRRRLMHLKIARLMRAKGTDPLLVAHHATAGGDTEMAVMACIEAGRQALRLFAHDHALLLARRGRHYADDLPEPTRCERLIDLAGIELGASPLDDAGDISARLEQLAETALDHGRAECAWRCYKMLADIRWAKGAWSDARRDTLHSELVSRVAGDGERVVALAEAARCLAMLERDLDTAGALVIEAEQLARRNGATSTAIADAAGLLAAYRGQVDEARQQFRLARLLARQQGDRLSEFLALEHLATLEIEQENWTAACALSAELMALAARIRPGSEQPFAEALHAICCEARSQSGDLAAFDRAMNALRSADSKHRITFAAVIAAQVLLDRGLIAPARRLAEEALEASTALNRRSGQAWALAMLVEVAYRTGEDKRPWQDRLRLLADGTLAEAVRRRAGAALAEPAAAT